MPTPSKIPLSRWVQKLTSVELREETPTNKALHPFEGTRYQTITKRGFLFNRSFGITDNEYQSQTLSRTTSLRGNSSKTLKKLSLRRISSSKIRTKKKNEHKLPEVSLKFPAHFYESRKNYLSDSYKGMVTVKNTIYDLQVKTAWERHCKSNPKATINPSDFNPFEKDSSFQGKEVEILKKAIKSSEVSKYFDINSYNFLAFKGKPPANPQEWANLLNAFIRQVATSDSLVEVFKSLLVAEQAEKNVFSDLKIE